MTRSESAASRRIGIRVVDLVLVAAAFLASFWARTNWDVLTGGHGALVWMVVTPWNWRQFTALLLTLWVSVWVSFDRVEANENLRTLRPVDEAFLAVRALTWSHIALLAAASQYSRYAFSRSSLLFLYPLSLLFVCTWRIGLKRRLAAARQAGTDLSRMLVVGAGETGQMVRQEVSKHPEWGIRMVGFVDDDPGKAGTEVGGVPVLGTHASTAQLACEHGAESVLIAIPGIARPVLLALIRQCEDRDLRVAVVPSFADLATTRGPVFHMGAIPVLPAQGEPIRGWGRVVKRAFDFAVASVLLVLAAPFLALLALLIRFDSPGPAIYRQRRVGRAGREFVMFKFRSMNASAEEQRPAMEHLNESQDGVVFKVRADPRITRVGRWLRRFSLDELPQLWNVVLGEMSLVGPRPPLVSEVNLYQQWVKKRLEAVPGLTGLWQVSGRSEIGFNRMVEMDLFYIEHWSFGLDLNILLRTIPAVLSGRGAY